MIVQIQLEIVLSIDKAVQIRIVTDGLIQTIYGLLKMVLMHSQMIQIDICREKTRITMMKGMEITILMVLVMVPAIPAIIWQ